MFFVQSPMRRRWQLFLVGLAAVCMTVLGILIAFANHIEEPPHDAELLAIGTVALCNLFWFVPWTVVQRKRGDGSMVLVGWGLFGSCWIHFPYRYFHHPRFDPNVWRSSTNPHYSYAGLYPAHEAGYMVTDLIESGVCLGKSLTEIEELLGPDHFHELGLCDSCIAYFYSGQVLFDGCNKLGLRSENGVCVMAGFAGCD